MISTRSVQNELDAIELGIKYLAQDLDYYTRAFEQLVSGVSDEVEPFPYTKRMLVVRNSILIWEKYINQIIRALARLALDLCESDRHDI